MSDDTRPRFTHDCDRCVFLGADEKYDFWFCPNTKSVTGQTVIARFGSEGPEYASGLEIAQALAQKGGNSEHPLVKALHLAEAQGMFSKREEKAFELRMSESGRCRHCGKERCYAHCQKADDAKHEADPETITKADTNGDFIVDILCKHCNQSGSTRIDPQDIQWE